MGGKWDGEMGCGVEGFGSLRYFCTENTKRCLECDVDI